MGSSLWTIILYDTKRAIGVSLHDSIYRMCSRHFDEDCYAGPSRRRLTSTAIPTLNLGNRPVEPIPEVQDEEPVLELTPRLPHIEVPETHPLPPIEEPEPMVIETPTLQKDLHILVPSDDVRNVNVGASTSSQVTSPQGTQTPRALAAYTPRKDKLRKRIVQLRKENTVLKKKLEKETELHASALDRCTDDDIKHIVHCNFPPPLAAFISQQYDLIQSKNKGQRYTDDFKSFCLKIHFLSPKAYRFLQTCFMFPSRRTLSRSMENIRIEPGFCDGIFSLLKIKVSALADLDKNCAICFDEMSIKAFLFYNISCDEVVGFENLGEGNTFNPALNVLTFMVKGIYNNWTQPLAYFFVHNTCSGDNLKSLLFSCVDKLKEIGLIPRVLIGDMGPSNIKLSNLLNITEDRSYFNYSNKRIHFIFDVPHLIKATRNCLYANNIFFENKLISWKYIEQMYNIDKNLQSRLAPKLTDSHIHPISRLKMKVSLATQLLSRTTSNSIGVLVSLGHMPLEASETQKYVETMDNLFDTFNSSNLYSSKTFNRGFKGEEYHISLLNSALNYFKNIKVINKDNVEVTTKNKSLKCWQISINGLIGLWDDLKLEGFTFLLTRRLNQDALENFFGTVRRQSGCCVNPTPIQFQRAFKKLFVLKFLNSGTENCTEDYNTILANFKDFQNKAIFVPQIPRVSGSQNVSANLIIDTGFRQHYANVEKNSIRYMCGYLIKNCLKIHSCDECETYANEHQDLDETTLFCHFKAYQTNKSETFGSLLMPSNHVFFHVCELEDLFSQNFVSLVTKKNFIDTFVTLCRASVFSHPCPNFPYSYFIKLYSRMRLFYTLKFVNRNFKTITSAGEKTHRKIIIWRHD